jgi:hypothetical protein
MEAGKEKHMLRRLAALSLLAILSLPACIVGSAADDPVNRRESPSGKRLEELGPPGGLLIIEKKEPVPRCSRCLAEVNKDARICPKCGQPLP